MKKIKMFLLESCPYCREALKWIDELYLENPAYKELELEKIDEEKNCDIAERYDYYYVPTFYVGDEKRHEGVATKDAVRNVFDEALK